MCEGQPACARACQRVRGPASMCEHWRAEAAPSPADLAGAGKSESRGCAIPCTDLAGAEEQRLRHTLHRLGRCRRTEAALCPAQTWQVPKRRLPHAR